MFDDCMERLKRHVDAGPQANDYWKLVHVHIPKTAGVSFLGFFKALFPDNKHLRWNFAAEDWREVARQDKIPKFTTGHLRFRNVFFRPFMTSKPIQLVSMIRDPLDRMVSDYNYMRSVRHPDNASFFEHNPSFEIYVERRIKNPNIQSEWLCGRNDSWEDLLGAVNKHYCGIAPVEFVSQYAEKLRCAFSDKQAQLTHKNELQEILHGEKVSKSDISKAALNEFRAANAMDYRLFEWVNEYCVVNFRS